MLSLPNIKLPPQVLNTLKTLQNSGFESYLVGGCVRDLLLNRQISDWDFTTNATPKEIIKIFPESFYDNHFGTVGIKIKNINNETEDIFEITPYRKESNYSDVRHPDKIEWAKTIEEDLARRDFTINALALTSNFDLSSTSYHIIDPFDGQIDLQNKLIRCVGNPNSRFQEDALRLLRAIRFTTQLQFTIEEKTWEAIKNNSELISYVSYERIRDEIIKILQTEFPADGVYFLYNCGLLKQILPEITFGEGIKQPGHHIHDVFTHSIESLRFCKNPSWLVRFAALVHDVGKPPTYKNLAGKITFYGHEVVGARIAKEIANRLHFSKEQREKLFTLVRWHMFSVNEFQTDSAIRRFIRRIGAENTADMIDIRIADRIGSGSKETSWRLEEFKQRVIDVQRHIPSVKDLKVNGNDIMQTLNIPPSRKVGEILNQLFEEILEDPNKNEKDYLLTRIQELA